MTQDEERSLGEWGALLKKEWAERAQSSSCHFFVASHAGWDDTEQWERRAEGDADFCLTNLAPEQVARMQVLEIGCGVGRLAKPLSRRVTGYTGFDVAPDMVAQARSNLEGTANARCFESDGHSIPAEARDRRYDLVLAAAVFIHCPLRIIRSLTEDALSLLAPGGRARLHFRADVEDPTGYVPSDDGAVTHEKCRVASETAPDQQLIHDSYYAGHAFRYEELRALLEDLHNGEVILHRADLLSIYADLEPAAP